MIVYTRGKIETLLKIDFVRFCIVGGTGFVINFIILLGLHKLFHMPIFIAQLIGAEIALASNFFLHHNWTYKHKKIKKSITSLLLQFHATSWPAIIGSAVMVDFGVRFLHFSNFISLATSSVIALMWNFVWSKYVIWKNITSVQIEEIAQ